MAHDDEIDFEARLRRRQRRATVRAAIVLPAEAVPPAPAEGPKRTTMKVRSFRSRAQSEFARAEKLPRDLALLLEAVLAGQRDADLGEALGTDEMGLRDLERRFLLRVGRSVYVAAVEVVNRASRMRREELDR